MTVGRIEPFIFDRLWEFPVPPDVFWQTVSETNEFPMWWGWLRFFESEGLTQGSKTDFVVQGALPYKLHFEVLIERIIEKQLVDTLVSGDLDGPASLEIAPSSDGCIARLQWRLEPQEPFLRRLSRISHPLLSWSHDQVVAMGVSQFRRRLARAQA